LSVNSELIYKTAVFHLLLPQLLEDFFQKVIVGFTGSRSAMISSSRDSCPGCALRCRAQGQTHQARHFPYLSTQFCLHLLQANYDIRTIQTLLGHKNVQTTMIYTHLAAKNILGVKSPLDS